MFTKPSSKTVMNWLYGLAACHAMILYGYDASTFNAVQASPHWAAFFNKPSASQIGTINSVYIVGNIVAGVIGAPFASDKLGRRATIAIGAVLVLGATFLQTFAPRGHLNAFLAGRFIVGLGQGFALPVGPVYVSEVMRPDVRGRLLGFWQLFYSVGSFIAFWISYACTKHSKALGEWDWKMVLIFQLLCPLLLLTYMPLIPESPRWLVQKGRIEDARRVLHRIRDTDEEVETELLEMREAIEFEQRELAGTGFWSAYKLIVMDKSLRKRMLICLVLNAGQQLTGQGSLVSYSSRVYKLVFKSADTIALINALNATFGILFTLTAVFFVDKLGRKFLLVVGAAGQAICMLVVAVVGSETRNYGVKADTKSLPVGIAIVFLLFLFILFYKPSWGATVWIFTAEVWSMNVRQYAVGFASQTQNAANIIINQFFPQFINKTGFRAFYLFAGINVGLFLFCLFVLPETKRVKLEDMDALFGGVNHIEKGEEIFNAGQDNSIHGSDLKNEVDHVESPELKRSAV